jgi:hypothetical protein
MSRRLMKALREGRLRQELKGIDREGRAAWAEMMNGDSNGRVTRGRPRKA